MSSENPFELKQVSIRLVEDAPVVSKEKINSPSDAVRVLGNQISQLDREVVCVINLKSDGTPINFSIVSMGAINESLVHATRILCNSR